MSTVAQSIGGEAVTTKLAMRMEDSLQAFAVRAGRFVAIRVGRGTIGGGFIHAINFARRFLAFHHFSCFVHMYSL